MKEINVNGSDLLVAARKNQLEEVRRLLTLKSFEVIADSHGNTALHHAVINNNVEMLEVFRMYGCKKMMRNHDWLTPLNLAVKKGYWSCVEAMAQFDEVFGSALAAALLGAVKERQYVTATKLLLKGADSNSRWYPTQYTALHFAVENNAPETISLLLRHDAPQMEQDDMGLTPIALAVLKGYWQCVVAFCDRKGLSEEEYSQALLQAARANEYGAVKALLSVGADPNFHGEDNNYAPLHWAVVNGNCEMAALLIHHKAKTDAYSKHGLTPMHLAIDGTRVAMISWLRHLGVSSDIKTQGGVTAAVMVSRQGNTECVDALYTDKKAPHQAHVALAEGNIEVLQSLIDSEGLTLTTKINPEGETLLTAAVRLRQSAVLQAFTESSDSTEARVAFSLAIKKGYWKCAEAIDKERGMVSRLDSKHYSDLSIWKFDNTQVKQSFKDEATLLPANEDCDKARFFELCAASKTARYRQFQFWNTEPTCTSYYFANHSLEPAVEQVVTESAP